MKRKLPLLLISYLFLRFPFGYSRGDNHYHSILIKLNKRATYSIPPKPSSSRSLGNLSAWHQHIQIIPFQWDSGNMSSFIATNSWIIGGVFQNIMALFN